MKYLLFLLCITFISNTYAIENENENLFLEIKRNITDKDYAIKLGQHLSKNEKLVIPVKESLRQAVIINSQNRNNVISFMESAGLINKTEREQILNQITTYNEIVKEFNNSVSDIDIERSYTSYNCTRIENNMYQPNVIVPFKRNLKISDVSAYQDFIRINSNTINIVQIPDVNSVIDHISEKENISFRDFEKTFIFNNSTSISMYVKVNNGNKTYDMFPYRIYPYESNDLAELTALQYGYFALNLKLVGLLTPEIYVTFKKIYRRNAALCLYSKK